MLTRKEPLQSGRETEIDMIEREMEGGVLVVQMPEAVTVQEDSLEHRLGGLIGVEEHVEVHERPTEPAAPKASDRARRAPSREK